MKEEHQYRELEEMPIEEAELPNLSPMIEIETIIDPRHHNEIRIGEPIPNIAEEGNVPHPPSEQIPEAQNVDLVPVSNLPNAVVPEQPARER